MAYGRYDLIQKYEKHPKHDKFTQLCKDGFKYGLKFGTCFGADKDIINFFGKRYEDFDEVEEDAFDYLTYNLEYHFNAPHGCEE